MSSLRLRQAGLRGRNGWRVAPLDLYIEAASTVLLLGPNGAGKSSLLRMLLGLEREAVGEVTIGDRDVRRLTPMQRAALLSWLPQQSEAVEPMQGVAWVAAGRYRFGEPAAVAEAAARRLLDGWGLGHLADRFTHELSGGEQQRLRIAALAAQEADWWLLDEPTNHLDPAARAAVVSQLGATGGGAAGRILATHDLTLLHAFPNARLLGLRAGEWQFDLTADADGLAEHLSALYETPVAEHQTDRERWYFFAGGS